jgi:hypothetical protein
LRPLFSDSFSFLLESTFALVNLFSFHRCLAVLVVSEHGIVLEKQLPADPGTTYPVCTDGKLAYLPEDCGGIPGSYDLLILSTIPTMNGTTN